MMLRLLSTLLPNKKRIPKVVHMELRSALLAGKIEVMLQVRLGASWLTPK